MKAIGHRIVRYDHCTSTNDVAAGLAADSAEHGTVVVADAQSAGRGRMGRHWYSPPGANLYISCILRPDLPPHQVPPITLCAGLAVAEAVNSLGIRPSIKWPNDVLIDERKLAGVLTETASRADRVDSVVVGIGVNVNDRSLPEDLGATSLAVELGRDVDREVLLGDLLGHLDGWFQTFVAQGVSPLASALWDYSALAGRQVEATVGGRAVIGRLVAVDDCGALVIEDANGNRHRVISGEIRAAESEARP